MNRILFYLIHISDLHFASTDKVTDDDPRKVPLLNSPFLKGFSAHDPNVVRDLASFIRKSRIKNPEARIVLTGDLTATGSPAEFARGARFLCSDGQKNTLSSIHYREWPSWIVPGSHDHWEGSRWNLEQQKVEQKEDMFHATPYWNTIWHLDNNISIRGIGLDTHSDNDIKDRVLGRGSFSSQIKEVSKELQRIDFRLSANKKEREIRVLFLHHPYSGANRKYMHQIDATSRSALTDFISEHRISVLCSGHLHIPKIQILSAVDGIGSRTVLEAVCGTTTQYTDDGTSSKQRARTLSGGFSRNSLVIHTVTASDGQLFWRAEAFGYTGWPRYFHPINSLHTTPEESKLAGEIRVWPPYRIDGG